MLYIKRLDLFLQTIFPLFGIILACFGFLNLGMICGLFGTGFAQIMSYFFHVPIQKELWIETKKRKLYVRLLLLNVIIGGCALYFFFASDAITTPMFVSGILLLITSIFQAVFYFLICMKELRTVHIMKK